MTRGLCFGEHMQNVCIIPENPLDSAGLSVFVRTSYSQIFFLSNLLVSTDQFILTTSHPGRNELCSFQVSKFKLAGFGTCPIEHSVS